MSHHNGNHGRFGEASPSNPGGDQNINGKGSANGHDLNGNGAPANGSSRRNLSEISHLFLSDLRQLNAAGRVPPKRIPPGAAASPAANDQTIDLTHDELLHPGQPAEEVQIPGVSVLLGARLNGTLIRRACQYAAGLADARPVGLIIVDASEIRLMWVAPGESETDDATPEAISTPEQLREVLLEMSCDLQRWLVVLPDPRLPQARRLLAMLNDWVLLATADHDGVVASYRTLKSLCDLELPAGAEDPRVTLALIDAESAADAQRHARKLVGVCRQFLDLEINAELPTGEPAAGAVTNIEAFTAREVVCASWPTPEAARVAWPVLESVLARAGNHETNQTEGGSPLVGPAPAGEISMFYDPSRPEIPDSAIPPLARPAPRAAPQGASGKSADEWVHAGEGERVARRGKLTPPATAHASPEPAMRRLVDQIEIPELARPAPIAAPAPTPAFHEETDMHGIGSTRESEGEEVIELHTGETVAEVVLARLNLATTPVCPPMLPGAKLCVARDGALTLVAAAAPGLNDLPTIGRAMTWAVENRNLLKMALTQYRVSETADVQLHLLVSRADAGADALRPLLSTGRVTVQTYRRLTWAGRCGVLLEAA